MDFLNPGGQKKDDNQVGQECICQGNWATGQPERFWQPRFGFCSKEPGTCGLLLMVLTDNPGKLWGSTEAVFKTAPRGELPARASSGTFCNNAGSRFNILRDVNSRKELF